MPYRPPSCPSHLRLSTSCPTSSSSSTGGCCLGRVSLHPPSDAPPLLSPRCRRVSLDARDNKMGSANLALVFGPTLTRAPNTMDPRQLHNDVPAVNLLIQLCINFHKKIFGGEHGEEEGDEKREGSPTPLSPGCITISPSNTMETVGIPCCWYIVAKKCTTRLLLGLLLDYC